MNLFQPSNSATTQQVAGSRTKWICLGIVTITFIAAVWFKTYYLMEFNIALADEIGRVLGAFLLPGILYGLYWFFYLRRKSIRSARAYWIIVAVWYALASLSENLHDYSRQYINGSSQKSSSTPPATPDGYYQYTGNGFTLTLPDSMRLDDSYTQPSFFIAGEAACLVEQLPSSGNYSQRMLRWMVHSSDKAFEEATLKLVVGELPQDITDYKVLSRESIDDGVLIKTSYTTHDDTETIPIISYNVLKVDGERAVKIECLSNSEDFERLESLLLATATSLNLK